jgi:hypothetical protein
MSISRKRSWSRARRFCLGIVLLTLPACGLSEYEGLMQKAQERGQRFREEQKYLDVPVYMPTEKDKDNKDTLVADVFFRPPKGIASTPEPQPRNGLMWKYLAGSKGSEFKVVEMAFADPGDSEFAKKVVNNYPRTEQVPNPDRKQTWPFDSWEFNDRDYGYSINIYKGSIKQVAVVFMFPKPKRDVLRKTMDLSLQTLTDKVATARQQYNQKSPWKLEK